MESFVQFLAAHAGQAHWFILLGLLLAGCNIPISIDALVIGAALISVHFVPENTYLLYFFLLFGCYFSGWIAYLLGRTVGTKLQHFKPFKELLSEKKMLTIQKFYKRHGVFTFIIGRFIPFGVRNCLFMSSGLTKMPFARFAILDGIACFIWVSLFFTTFLHLGYNFDALWSKVRTLNIFIFLVFAVAVIATIWYKRRKRSSI